MKRLLLLLVVITLALPGAAWATGRGFLREWDDDGEPVEEPIEESADEEPVDEEAVHLLWDIPFGISGEEVYTLVLEETGLMLESGIDQWGDRALLSTKTPQPEMLGYPVLLSFSLDEDDRLGRVAIQFEGEDEYMLAESYYLSEDLVENIVELLDDYDWVHEALLDRYGVQQGGLLAVEGADREMAFFDYPGGEWGLDMRQIARVASENAYCAVVTRYGNVIETAILHTSQSGSRAYVRLQLMLMLFPLPGDYGEIAPEMPAMDGYTTPNGLYRYKGVEIGL